MTDDFFDHLAHAARHTVLAAAALVPPRARPHLAALARDTIALLESLAGPVPEPGRGASSVRPRRIDIEE